MRGGSLGGREGELRRGRSAIKMAARLRAASRTPAASVACTRDARRTTASPPAAGAEAGGSAARLRAGEGTAHLNLEQLIP